ncbi:MAG: fasciclin domain-containing protein [Phaeospirillum sp.]|nr:fasciclin domain-containing protein [Phaeospirillum sp.]
MKITFVVALWGEWYTDVFCSLMAKSMLADGNFPSIGNRAEARLRIYCDAATRASILAWTGIVALQTTIPVDFVLFKIDYRAPISSHHQIWADALVRARREKGTVVFLAPDTIWSDGSVSRLIDVFSEGYAAAFFPGFRVASDTFFDSTRAEFSDECAPISLPGPELMRRAMENMHPLKSVFVRHSPAFPDHGENMLWPVGDEGYVLREAITHSLFAVNPSLIDVNNFTVPVHSSQIDRIYWASGSDDILFLSLGPVSRDINWYEASGPISAERLALKSLAWDSPLVSSLIRRRFRFHSGVRDEASWRAVERASDLFTHRLLVSREVLRLIRAVDDAGCRRAAEVLTLALTERSLSHAVTTNGPMTFFCPMKLPSLQSFVDYPGHKLRHLILSHATSGRLEITDLKRMGEFCNNTGCVVRVSTEHGNEYINGSRLIAANISCGEHIIHLVDKMISSA